MSLVSFKAKNHPQQVRVSGPDDDTDDRRTPSEIFDPLNSIYRFTLDAAANRENTKCGLFYDREADGLLQPWKNHRVWLNPPYSSIGNWVEKAIVETSRSCPLVVMLLPANRCEQRWWQKNIEPNRDFEGSWIKTKFLPGRPRFGWPENRVVPKKGDRPPFGLVLVTITKPRSTGDSE